MAVSRISDDRVVDISGWNKYCARACLADYVGWMLTQEDSLSDEAVDNLCDMFGKYYGVPGLKKQHLVNLFTNVYPSPYQWQTILGLVFDQEIKDHFQGRPEAKGQPGVDSPINQDGTMSFPAFAPIASKLGFSVQIYREAKDNNGIVPYDHVPVINPGMRHTMDVYYHSNGGRHYHYDRIAKTADEAKRHNDWGFADIRELPRDAGPVAVKGVVQKELQKVVRGVRVAHPHRAEDKIALPRELLHISRMDEKKAQRLPDRQFQLFNLVKTKQVQQANTFAKQLKEHYQQRYDSFKQEQELDQKLDKKFAGKPKDTQKQNWEKSIGKYQPVAMGGNYDLDQSGPKNGPKTYVDKAKQEELDEQLAWALQEEEYFKGRRP